MKKLITIFILLLVCGLAKAQFGGATGTSGDPYQISTVADLQLLAKIVNGTDGYTKNDYSGKYFLLRNNIDLSASDWTPIGTFIVSTSTLYPFNGTFDGNSYTITGLKINASTSDYQGLFGYINSGCVIKNLTIYQCNIAGGNNVGGVAGDANGATITNCYVTSGTIAGNYAGGVAGKAAVATITNCYVNSLTITGGGNNVGGLAGYASGSTITNCYVTSGTITGVNIVGGVCGNINSSSNISQCWSSCSNITGTTYVGGIGGVINNSAISNCFARSNVTGTSYIGGLAGYSQNSTIVNCYSIGSTTGTSSPVQGFIGSISSGTITNSFWDTQISGGINSTGVTGMTTNKMNTASTFTLAGWSASLWRIVDGSYPSLLWQLVTVTNSAASSITTASVTLGGTANADGGAIVTERGVVYSTSDITPSIEEGATKISVGSGTGSFTQSIGSLTPGTLYYYNTYAISSQGTIYGTQKSFTTLTNGTFTGATNNDWNTADNWAGGSVPTSSLDVTIPSGQNPVISATTSANCNNLTVASGSTLTIASTASGTGSLIISGTSTGNVSCQNYIIGSRWHIISPNASGGNINTFIQDGSNALPVKNVSGTNNYGMMDYNETTNLWKSYFTAATGAVLTSGQGYSIQRTSNGIVTFTGTLTSGTKTVALTKSGAGWNCIGNPYTSAIKMNTAADPSYNFLKTNAIDASQLDPSYACMYLWDDDSHSYKILGNSSYT